MQAANYKHKKRMSMILSRVDCSESRDEIISSVQNQKFQEATRSITPCQLPPPRMETHLLASHEQQF